jgi:hypothetical protein
MSALSLAACVKITLRGIPNRLNYCEIFRSTLKHVKLTTLVSMPPVIFGPTLTEPANSYDVVHVHYSTTWPPFYLESWQQFHI